ncbi:MAG: hypothetical protein WC586_06025 [Methanoregula sp.]
MKLPGSNSEDWSVFSTNGERLAGDLPGYNELAHQLDKKRILFYCTASNGEILLGTRLLVRIIGGREERAIFIKRYAGPGFFSGRDFISRFYEEAKVHVMSLPQIRYQVLGLQKDGDLPIKEQGIVLPAVQAITGKVLLRKPVKIKIEDLSLSFATIRKIIETFSRKKIPCFTLTIAQYPFDEDVLISPSLTGMDLEITEDGVERIPSDFLKNQRLFSAVSSIYDQQQEALRDIDFTDKPAFSKAMKHALAGSGVLSEIPLADPDTLPGILDLYREDPALLSTVFRKIFRKTGSVHGADPETLAIIARQIIDQLEEPDGEDQKLLEACYTNGDDELKTTILHTLISAGAADDYLVQDLLDSCIRTANLPLLQSALKNKAFSNRKLQVLTGGIHLSLAHEEEVLDFINALFEADLDRQPDGKSVYQAIIQQYREQKFDTRALNQLQGRSGRELNPASEPGAAGAGPSGNRTKILLVILVICLAIAGLILLSFMGLPGQNVNQTPAHTIPAGNLSDEQALPGVTPAINPVPTVTNLPGTPVP